MWLDMFKERILYFCRKCKRHTLSIYKKSNYSYYCCICGQIAPLPYINVRNELNELIIKTPTVAKTTILCSQICLKKKQRVFATCVIELLYNFIIDSVFHFVVCCVEILQVMKIFVGLITVLFVGLITVLINEQQ